jgi:hypothetical protein
MDVRRKMPVGVESDLDLTDLTLHFGRSFEIVVQAVNAERVPIGEGSRFASPVPRAHGLAAPNLYQQPSPIPGTETGYSEQESVVTRLCSFP